MVSWVTILMLRLHYVVPSKDGTWVASLGNTYRVERSLGCGLLEAATDQKEVAD